MLLAPPTTQKVIEEKAFLFPRKRALVFCFAGIEFFGAMDAGGSVEAWAEQFLISLAASFAGGRDVVR